MKHREKHPRILHRWMKALGEAGGLLGTTHWDMYAAVQEQIRKGVPPGNVGHARTAFAFRPKRATSVLSMKAIKHGCDLDETALHETQHVWLQDMRETLDIPSELWEHPKLKLLWEAICEHAVLIVRNARARKEI